MDAACLAHQLTEDERARFEHDGYFVVAAALDRPLVARLREIALAHFEQYRRREGITRHHLLNEHDLVGKEDEWLELVDHPTTFPKVWGVLGWHIQLFHTQLLVTPPAPANAEPAPYGWHQDNNRMNLDLDTAEQPMISCKVGYFLSDVSRPGMANLYVAPGSHRVPHGHFDAEAHETIALTAQAGDAVVFDRRLWHSASTNCSPQTRIFVTYGYSHRWLRPKSAMRLDHLFAHVDPVRRQLLGYATDANGYYDPQPDDVPLRDWIARHVGPASVVP